MNNEIFKMSVTCIVKLCYHSGIFKKIKQDKYIENQQLLGCYIQLFNCAISFVD